MLSLPLGFLVQVRCIRFLVSTDDKSKSMDVSDRVPRCDFGRPPPRLGDGGDFIPQCTIVRLSSFTSRGARFALGVDLAPTDLAPTEFAGAVLGR